tara:strand:+ start:264 stop:398 length:135 start_codon:yes stop_codon:yes gene_type:complete
VKNKARSSSYEIRENENTLRKHKKDIARVYKSFIVSTSLSDIAL